MAKAKAQAFGTGKGYTDWGVMRTIREAENIARWSPWHTHEWMEEAVNRLDIMYAPYHEEYDAAVKRINHLWLTLRTYSWFDEKTFWAKGKTIHPPKLLQPILED